MKRKNKLPLLIGGLVLIILIVGVVYFFIFSSKDEIKFIENKTTIEYGEPFEFKDSIEDVVPEEANVQYPDIKLDEVGTYNLVFVLDVDGDKVEQEQQFIVQDTKKPKFDLKFKKDRKVEIAVNSKYDPMINIDKIKNMDEEGSKNRIKLSKDDYKKMVKETEKAHKKLNERIIVEEKDKKKIEAQSNFVFYETNLDVSKKGTYKVKVAAVDENYNLKEISWEVKVVPEGTILNTGGTISCNYNSSELPVSEGFDTTYTEDYLYDSDKFVSSLKFTTVMNFKPDYQSNENIVNAVAAINEEYASVKSSKGVVINVTSSATSVVTEIIVDFKTYNMDDDPLEVLVEKGKGKILATNIVKGLEGVAVCKVK